MTEVDELEVMSSVRQALLLLPDDVARLRVLRWAGEAIGGTVMVGPSSGVDHGDTGTHLPSSLTALLDAAQPETRAERILTVAYWLDRSTGGGDFSSQAVNDELKNLGDGVPNITDALSSLINRKPALIRQVRKTGRAQQARKRYALTAPGRSLIAEMINRPGTNQKEQRHE